MLSLLWLLIVGLVAGLLAPVIVPGKNSMSRPATMVLGLIGSAVGGLSLGLLTGGLSNRGVGPAGLIGSVIGSVIVLMIYNRLSARRSIRQDAGPRRA